MHVVPLINRCVSVCACAALIDHETSNIARASERRASRNDAIYIALSSFGTRDKVPEIGSAPVRLTPAGLASRSIECGGRSQFLWPTSLRRYPSSPFND